MSFSLTLSIFMAEMVLFECTSYMSQRPSESGMPKLVPWTELQFLGPAAVILMLAHLVTLLTGTLLEGRYIEATSSPDESVGREDWRGRKSQIVSCRSRQGLRPNISMLTIRSGFQTLNSKDPTHGRMYIRERSLAWNRLDRSTISYKKS